MATRLYLPSSTAAPPISPSFDVGWDQTASADRLKAVTTKLSTAMVEQIRTGSTTNGQDYLLRQYVTDALSGAQTITGTFNGMARCREFDTSTDARAQVVVRVIAPDGTVRGTLIAVTAGTLTNEWATALTPRRFPRGSAGFAVTSVDALDGDYIVIELGFRVHNTRSTAGRNDGIEFGDNSVTDQTTTESGQAGANPWMEFSQTLVFSAPDTTAPVVTIQSVDTTRISRVSGKDTITVTFQVNETYQAYQVRAVPGSSSPVTAGTQVESGAGGAANTNHVVSLTDDELVAAGMTEGSQIIKVFAQDTAGNWSE